MPHHHHLLFLLLVLLSLPTPAPSQPAIPIPNNGDPGLFNGDPGLFPTTSPTQFGEPLEPCPATCTCSSMAVGFAGCQTANALWTGGAAAFPFPVATMSLANNVPSAAGFRIVTPTLNLTNLIYNMTTLVDLAIGNILATQSVTTRPLCDADMVPYLAVLDIRHVYFGAEGTLDTNFFGDYCAKLRRLSISQTNLVRIAPGALRGALYLGQLDMTGNAMLLQLPVPLLPAAAPLTFFVIATSNLTSVSPNLLLGLNKLTTVVISNARLTTLPAGLLANNTGLLELDFTGNPLLTLPAASLPAHMPQLNAISCSSTFITELPSNVLAAPSLTLMDICCNQLTTLGHGPLASTQISSFQASHNNLTSVPANLLRNSASTLTAVFLSNNTITALAPDFFQNFSQLVTVDISNNLLTEVAESIFAGSHSLSDVQVAYNRLHSIPSLFSATNASGPSESYSAAANLFSNLWNVQLDGNALTTLPISLFRAGPGQPPPAALSQFSARGNRITMVESGFFAGMGKLFTCYLSNNLLSRLPDFSGATALNEIELGGNRLTTLAPGLALGSSSKLTFLYLNLADNLLSNPEPSLLPVNLRGLSLAGNPLTAVPPRTFQSVSLSDLGVLDLSRCQITTIGELAFDGLKSLSTLNLTQNPLTFLSKNAFGSAFSSSSGTYNPINAFTTTNQGLILLNSNLSATLDDTMFLLLPELVRVQLGYRYVNASSPNASSTEPLVLDSCCGYEWLANPNPQFEFDARSIRCRLDPHAAAAFAPVPVGVTQVAEWRPPGSPATTCISSNSTSSSFSSGGASPDAPSVSGGLDETQPLVVALRNHIICPCLPSEISINSQYSLQTCDDYASNLVLVGRRCRHKANAICPTGSALKAVQGPTERAINCTFLSFPGQPPLVSVITESRCAPCALPGCAQCIVSRELCQVCSPPTILLGSSCVDHCPLSYTSAVDVATRSLVCYPCADSACLSCTHVQAGIGSVCTVCNNDTVLFAARCLKSCPDLYGPVSGPVGGLACAPCTVQGCQVCNNGTSSCTSCARNLFLSGHKCVTACPAGTVPATTGSGTKICTAVPVSSGSKSRSSALSSTHLAIVVACSVALFVLVLVLVVVKMRGRFGVIESDLRERLLSSEEEVLALRQVWQIAPEELQMVRRIDVDSPGVFGEVWLAKMNGSTDVAVKKLREHMLHLNDEAQLEFEQEVAFMQTIRHANLVAFLGAGEFASGQPFLVLEYMVRGSLRKILTDSPEIAWSRKLRFCHDVVLGMRHLHSLGRIHRDLKSDNVLVAADFRAKVADFGQSRILTRQRSPALGASRMSSSVGRNNKQQRQLSLAEASLTTNIGTPLWMAPEMLAGEPYTNKVDVWSMAIVFWEVLTQDMPWADLPAGVGLLDTLLQAIQSGQRLPVPASTPPAYRAMLEACWQLHPARRPSFAELAKLDLFTGSDE